MLTLYTTPVIYLQMERLRARISGDARRHRRARARPAGGARNPRNGRRNSHEHLRARHPPAGRHHAARHRAVAGGRGGVSFPAGGQHADGRFPDHQRERKPARRRPRNHGGDSRGPARTPARRNPGRDRDDLAQFARLHAASPSSSISTAISTAPRATCRPRSMPRRPTCRATCKSRPSFRKSNPAATPIMILALTSRTMSPASIYDIADTVVAQRLAQVDGVAEVSVNGAEQPAIRVRVNPIALASMGLSMEDVRTSIANTNAAGPARRVRRRRPRRHHRHQRSAPRRLAIRPAGGARPPTARWCGFPPSPRSSPACATAAPSAGTTASPRCCW